MKAATLFLSLITVLGLVPEYSGRAINMKDNIEYVSSDREFAYHLEKADKSTRLAVILFVDSFLYFSEFKEIGENFKDTLFIRVNAVICPEAQKLVAPDGEPFIRNLPTIVIRQAGRNRVMFDEITDIKNELPELINEAKKKSGHKLRKIVSDDDYKTKLGVADKRDQLNVIYVGKMSLKYHWMLKRFGILYPTALFFEVNASECKATKNAFGVKSEPKIVLRRFRTDQCVLNSPKELELKVKIEQYLFMPKPLIVEVVNCSEFNDILTEADESDKLVILFVVKKIIGHEGIEPYVKTLELLNKSNVTVLKINSDVCPEVESFFSEAAADTKNIYPKFIFRKYGTNRLRLFGYAWFQFYGLTMECKDIKKEIPIEEASTKIKDVVIYDDDTHADNPEEEASCEIKNFKLPLLQNGSTIMTNRDFSDLLGGTVILTNTCAFDSLTSIIMVAYSDSKTYAKKLDSSKNDFFSFISKLVKHGITPMTLLERSQLIMYRTSPRVKRFPDYSTTHVECNNTIHNMINSLFEGYPTKRSYRLCIQKCDSKSQFKNSSIKPEVTITYQSPNTKIKDLQQFLSENFESETTKCINESDPTILCNAKFIKQISDMHLLIEAYYWNDSISDFVTKDKEITDQVIMRLCDIPKNLKHNTKSYDLRGVISLRLGGTTRDAIGHYYAYAYRGTTIWQLYDDLKAKPVIVDDKTEVVVELLVYTI